MSSTASVDEIYPWLAGALQAPEISEVWGYGSFAESAQKFSDVDIIVKYRQGWTLCAARFRRQLEARFLARFEVPLHAIFLSDAEWLSELHFVNVLLGKCRVRIDSNNYLFTAEARPD